MFIGGSVALMALGAILAFAVNVMLSGLDLAVVGWILMVAGLALLVADLAYFAPRRRGAVVQDSVTYRARDVY